jgi:mannose-6-phosphate isomerase-like protein (cupin superfamily)
MTATMTKATPEQSNIAATGEPRERRQGTNFSLVRLGGVHELRDYGIKHPLMPVATRGKVFLKELLGLTAMEISFGVMAAGKSMPFHHKHKVNEEVYLFLRGKGQVQIDGEIMAVEEGTAVRVAPEGVRSWRNTGDEDLFYVCIQAKEGSLTAWTISDGVSVPGPVEWSATT